MTDAMALSREGQANMPLLIESLGLQTSKRLEHLADLIAIESTLGRLRAAMTLSRYQAEDARAALRPLTLDRSPWVARLAAHAALAGAHRDDRIAAVAAGLLASPHPLVTRRARWLLSKTSSSLFFEHWLKLEQSERFAAARVVCAREMDAFVDELSAALNAGQRAERLSALTLASRLRLVSDLEQDIIVLAGSSDPHVASTAVAALGRHISPRASEAVRVALRHTDARVRANAVESLARHDAAGALATIAALADHRHNRLRGNAVLALVRSNQPVGAQALRAMLADSDPMHRVSGIWVVGRANATFARSDVRTLAERDGRIEIRKRAARTLRRIDHATRPLELTEAMHA
jgi:HEAT repeat protein